MVFPGVKKNKNADRRSISMTTLWKAVTAIVNQKTRNKYRHEYIRDVKLGQRTNYQISDIVDEAYKETRRRLREANVAIISLGGRHAVPPMARLDQSLNNLMRQIDEQEG